MVSLDDRGGGISDDSTATDLGCTESNEGRTARRPRIKSSKTVSVASLTEERGGSLDTTIVVGKEEDTEVEVGCQVGSRGGKSVGSA